MKKICEIFCTFVFVIVLTFFCANQSACARSISYSKYNINANVNSDGSMNVTEIITYDFNGSYNGVYRDISFEGASGISDLSINKITEYGVYEPVIQNDSNSPDTYTVSDEGSLKKIKLYTPSQNTQKTYVYSYTINGVIKKYNDISELYWQFIPQTNETPTKNLEIVINIPKGAEKENLKIYAHGPLWGVSEILNDTSAKLSISNVPAYQMVEARLLFPSTLIFSEYPTIAENKLDSVVSEETKWANDANSVRSKSKQNLSRFSSFSYILGYLIPSLLTIAALVLYFLYIWRPKPVIDYDYYRELPGDYSPAQMSVLMDSNTEIRDISATLLDLVRRKHLILEETKETKEGIFSSKEMTNYILTQNTQTPDNDLRKHEKYLIDWFFKDLDTNGKVDFNEIQNKLKRSQNRAKEFQTKLSEWKKRVKEDTVSQGLVEDRMGMAVGVGVFIVLYTFFFMHLFPFNVLTFLPLIAALILIKNTTRKTAYGMEQYYKWKAFKKFLKDFSMLDQATVPSLIIWEHYLVYAIPLGVAKEVIKQLKLVIPEDQYSNSNLTYLHYNDFIFNNSFASFDSFVSDINSTAVANSPNSSGGGGGGGFSGGGGFGGGGGGGGGGF